MPMVCKKAKSMTGIVIPVIKKVSLPEPSYKQGEMVAPRKAYGQALHCIGPR